MSNHSKAKFRLLVFLFACFSFSAYSQQLFTDVNAAVIPQKGTRFANPSAFKSLKLDAASLQMALSTAPLKDSNSDNKAGVALSIPMPDGSIKRFTLYETPVMHPDLQAKYPQIRCYTGYGVDDRSATLKCDWTPRGFHAMVFSGEHNAVAIEPYQLNDTEHYLVFYKKDYNRFKHQASFMCAEDEENPVKIDFPKNEKDAGEFVAGDCKTRKYRLALSCTGEYATFHGGTKVLVLAAMNTTMNRVNGLYERDLSISMQIIPNNDLLIYLNSSTDPFTNGNGGTMLGQNQSTVTSMIGSSNYDIGHVFSTGGGGVAGLGVVCSSNSKARGVTGQGQPIGDFFDIDYVAHEMGHQFGANHTFYNSCGGNKNASTAFEPGSGVTIMAYAGICAPDIQNNSSDYFHAISIQEIGTYVVNGGGASCAVTATTMNHAPVVTGLTNRTIPISTPFALTATATDADNDAMTYCWEQMDATGSSPQPPVGSNTTGPMFRSNNPTTSPTRYFPSLTNVINSTTNTWETLPTASRSLNFRVSVRDNHQGNGCTGETSVLLTTAASAGPFIVTAPNTNVVWFVGEQKEVTWNVANTNTTPVSCSNVRITLSTDGGLTYPTVLSDDELNDGSAMVNVPDAATTMARVRVEAKGNYFYDISNQNFRIEIPPTPTFILSIATADIKACAGQNANVELDFQSLLNFSNPVQLAVSGVPAGASGSFSSNPASPAGMSTYTLSGLTAAMAGTYTLNFTATSGTIVRMGTASVEVLPGAPATAPANALPSTYATGTSTQPILSWNAVPYASSYLVELASNPSFSASAILQTKTTASTSFQPTALAGASVYYWRVKADNLCGASAWTTTSSFQTGTMDCGNIFSSTNTVLISDVATATVTDMISIVDTGSVESISLSLAANHSWVGDLSVTLQGPNGQVVELFDQPGVPGSQYGCEGDNVALTFDDAAAGTAAQLENLCNASAPALSGAFRPIDPLSAYAGSSMKGNWTLSITDHVAEDGGALTGWSLDICKPLSLGMAAVLTNSVLTVNAGQSGTISTSLLSAQVSGMANTVQYVLTKMPASGSLAINGMPASLGTIFTQADIDANVIVYTHGSNTVTMDGFNFDLFDSGNNAWLPNQHFSIAITQNSISAQVATTTMVLCANGTGGSITATASGGTAPFTYSLNTTNSFQASNVFTGLTAGTYSVVVKDNTGFTSTSNTVTLANPAALSISTSVASDAITAAGVGGTGALQYSLNGGAYQSSPTFSGLANGSYTVSVRDANGCTKQTTAIVALNSLVVSLSEQSSITCATSADGAIIANVGGGQGPYMYSLNGTTAVSTASFSGLSAGSYMVDITDSQGFSATTNVITLVAPSAITASSSVAMNVVTLTASGGTGALQYSIDGITFVSNAVFSGLNNGTYTFTIKDENGCTTTTMATVNVSVLAVQAVQTAQILCFGAATGQVTLSGSGGIAPYQYQLGTAVFQSDPVFGGLVAGDYMFTIRDAQGTLVSASALLAQPAVVVLASNVVGNDVTISAQGGVMPYTYAIMGGTAQGSGDFMNLVNAAYTFVVSDANGCSQSINATVNLSAITGTASTVAPLCNGGTNGSVSVAATGGQSPYTYQLGSGTFQNSSMFTGLSAGMYTITIKDAQNQTTPVSFTITQPIAISLTAQVNATTITSVASNGKAPYTYHLDNGPGQASGIFANVTPGTHNVSVTDANGCTSMNVEVMISFAPITVTTTSKVNPICAGGTNGSAIVAATGGQAPYTYQLNNGTPQNNGNFTGLGAGTYTVTVKDAQNQVSMISFTLTQPVPVNLTAQVTVYTVTAVASNGQAPYTYQLDNGTGQSSGTFANVSVGTHTVSVTDANGCTAASIMVTVVALPIGATATTTAPHCAGNSDGSVTIVATGGIAPFMYQLGSGTPQSSNTFTGLAAGTYSVIVTDAQNQMTTVPFTLNNPPALSVAGQVTGSTVMAVVTNGQAPFVYHIDNGAGQSSATFMNVSAGAHTISITDANGCTAQTQVTILTNTLNLSITQNTPSLCTGANNGSATLCIQSGTAPYTVTVSPSTFAAINAATNTCDSSVVISGLSPGAYTITVKDANGFNSISNFTSAQPAILISTAAVVNNTITMTTTGGVQPYTYSINGGSSQPSPTFIDLVSGVYTILVTDANGCTTSVSVTVSIIAAVEPNTYWGAAISPNPSSGLFTLSVNPVLQKHLTGRIVNLTGQLVSQFEFETNPTHQGRTLDLSMYADGVYILQLSDGQHTGALRLVKMN